MAPFGHLLVDWTSHSQRDNHDESKKKNRLVLRCCFWVLIVQRRAPFELGGVFWVHAAFFGGKSSTSWNCAGHSVEPHRSDRRGGRNPPSWRHPVHPNRTGAQCSHVAAPPPDRARTGPRTGSSTSAQTPERSVRDVDLGRRPSCRPSRRPGGASDGAGPTTGVTAGGPLERKGLQGLVGVGACFERAMASNLRGAQPFQSIFRLWLTFPILVGVGIHVLAPGVGAPQTDGEHVLNTERFGSSGLRGAPKHECLDVKSCMFASSSCWRSCLRSVRRRPAMRTHCNGRFPWAPCRWESLWNIMGIRCFQCRLLRCIKPPPDMD